MSKNSERTILVTGATGRQGGAAYQHLQKKGFKLRALVRDPNSNQAHQLTGYREKVFQGNLDDPDSLMRAMEGVYGVFSVQPYTANEIQQGVAVQALPRHGEDRQPRCRPRSALPLNRLREQKDRFPHGSERASAGNEPQAARGPRG